MEGSREGEDAICSPSSLKAICLPLVLPIRSSEAHALRILQPALIGALPSGGWLQGTLEVLATREEGATLGWRFNSGMPDEVVEADGGSSTVVALLIYGRCQMMSREQNFRLL